MAEADKNEPQSEEELNNSIPVAEKYSRYTKATLENAVGVVIKKELFDYIEKTKHNYEKQQISQSLNTVQGCFSTLAGRLKEKIDKEHIADEDAIKQLKSITEGLEKVVKTDNLNSPDLSGVFKNLFAQGPPPDPAGVERQNMSSEEDKTNPDDVKELTDEEKQLHEETQKLLTEGVVPEIEDDPIEVNGIVYDHPAPEDLI